MERSARQHNQAASLSRAARMGAETFGNLRLSYDVGRSSVTGLEHIELLKLCKQYDMCAAWGVVAEDRLTPLTDIAALELLEAMWALDPPTRVAPALAARADTDPLIERIQQWRRDPHRGSLTMLSEPDGDVLITDSRGDNVVRQIMLTGWRAAVYRAADTTMAKEDLFRIGRSRGALPGEIESFLTRRRKSGQMAARDGLWLALAVRRSASPAAR